jgi:hypothetical protein
MLEDQHTVTLTFDWAPLSTGTRGQHQLTAEGGNPHRETAGTILIDNDGSTVWFIDPTPDDASEFPTYSSLAGNLGGGVMNVSHRFDGGTGAAANWDLFTTCKHEIGHALGLSNANDAFAVERADGDVDVTTPRPYAGAAIPTVSSHLNLSAALMSPGSTRTAGQRTIRSAADVVADAQISKFVPLNYSGTGGTGGEVPGISGLGILALTTAILVVVFRRGWKRHSSLLLLVAVATLLFAPHLSRAQSNALAAFSYSTPSVAGTLLSANVNSQGQFQSITGMGVAATSHSGKISENETESLITEIEAAISETIVADDAGTLEINWVDASGKSRTGSCTTAYGSLCADLLKRIEALFNQ